MSLAWPSGKASLGQRTYFAASSLPGMPVLSVSAFGFDRAGSPVPALARRIAEERLEQAVAKAWDKYLGASHNKHELLNENDVRVRTTGDQLATDVNEIGLGFISVFRFPH